MARTKQATPLRRNPSSEYTSKAEAPGTPSRNPRNLDKEANGNAPAQNGHALGLKSNAPVKEKVQKEAGALQFVVAVGGIYGSLYV
jgi:UDP-galactose transporter B1